MPEAKRYVLSTAAGLGDDLIEIGGREFHAWPLKLAEADGFAAKGSYSDQLEALAKPLATRALDGKPVKGDWLREHIDKPFLEKLMVLLINGHLEENPKA